MTSTADVMLHDPGRLNALRSLRLLDTPDEAALDRLTTLAARLLSAPIALVTLIDEDRQVLKSRVLPDALSRLRETPISHSICRHSLGSTEPLLFEDVRRHPQVGDNPAIDAHGLVAYAGAPLMTASGHSLGSLCVLDFRPRAWSPDDVSTLRTLAAAVMSEIELRAVAQRAERDRAEYDSYLSRISDAFFALDNDGLIRYVNEPAVKLLGVPAHALHGAKFLQVALPVFGPAVGHDYAGAIEARQPSHAEHYSRSREAWFAIHVYPAADGVTIYARDVSPRRASEQRLAELNLTLEAQVAARTAELASSVLELESEIAERKHVEQLLQREQEFLATVLDNLRAGVVACDADGRLTLFNQASRDLHGLPAAPVPPELWRDYYDLYRLDGQTPLTPAEVPLLRALRGEIIRDDEIVIAPKNGASRVVLVSGQAIRDRSGATEGAVVAMHDVTAIVQAAKERRRAASQIALIAEVAAAISQGGPFRAVLQRVAEAIVTHLDATFARVWMVDEPAQLLELQASAGLYGNVDGPHSRIPIGAYKIGGVALRREPHFTNNVQNDPEIRDHVWARTNGLTSFAGYPLVIDDTLVGVVALFARHALSADTLDALGGIAFKLAQSIVRQRAESALRASEARYRAVIDTAPDAIVTIDIDATILSFNHGGSAIFGYGADEVVGKSMALLVPGRFKPGARDRDRCQVLPTEAALVGLTTELTGRRKDGSLFPLELSLTDVRSQDERFLTGIVRDVSSRKQFEARLLHQALHDPLTDLPNRTMIATAIENALQPCNASKGEVAVLFLDLDHFKVVNDSLGHEEGDRLLVAVADRMRAALGPTATIARFGGDEFAILVGHVASAGEAIAVADRVQAILRMPFRIDGHDIVTSASIGIVVRRPDGEAATSVLRHADVAMYQAKTRGPGHHALFEPHMSDAAVIRLAREVELRRALAAGQLTVHFQPKIALATGALLGFEALARWRHPERGWIPPTEFIAVAEETGLIVELGRFVVREACRHARVWHHACPDRPALGISVNLSATELQRPDLVDSIASILREEDLEARCLELEITESIVMADPAVTASIMRRLKALGLRISIDDFGTGYSSLAYLKHFPADVLKIDRAFVAALGAAAEDTALIGTMISIGHAFGMDVVAEGVETAAQVAQLAALNCDIGQGYWFARPLTADGATAFLRDVAHGRRLAPHAVSENAD